MATIEELEALLELAKTELVCADMIDSPARRDIQTSYWRERVAALEADLLDTGVGFNPYGSGPVPIEPKEGMTTHDDDLAVDRFASAMKDKLSRKRSEGRSGWQDKSECSQNHLSELLRRHVEKGDPVDVANIAMMLHQRGERIV